MKKVLLSTVQKPFGIENERVMPELFQGQITHAQGVFSFRSVCHGWGLEFIAKNLKTPTTVLHYPTEKKFIRELKKGYDYVGINFVMATWNKAKRLIEIVRENAPEAKIVLGGYGTVLGEVDEYADYVCRGEGLDFMQKLLGETSAAQYQAPVVTTSMKCMSIPVGKSGILFAGLGCPNGCDFCCTTHFFKKQHIPLLRTGKEIYEAMKQFDDIIPERIFTIIDEDFLKDKKRIEELYEYTTAETDNPRSFTCFASIKSIKQYDPEWLAELGVSTIWIGVESQYHRYEKTGSYDMREVFESLHQVGINTLGSMILGVDEHNKETIQKDIDYFISLRPSLSQFLIYSPCPRTPLWDRLDGEGRLDKDFPLDKRDGFHLLYSHAHFTAEEIEGIQAVAFDKDYRELGPSVIRYVEKCLKGYRYFANSNKAIHLARKKKFRDTLVQAFPLFGIAARYSKSEEARKWIIDLEKEVAGELDTREVAVARLMAVFVPLFAIYTKFTYKYTKFHLQPSTQMNRHNFGEAREPVNMSLPRVALEDV